MLASLLIIGAVYVLPFTVTETWPVAFSKPVTLTIASSPTVIALAAALIVKFFLTGTGTGLTIMLAVVEAGL